MLRKKRARLQRRAFASVPRAVRLRGAPRRLRQGGTALDVQFLGTLHDVQVAAVAAIEPHDYGVLAATTAFGKTVVGASCPARSA